LLRETRQHADAFEDVDCQRCPPFDPSVGAVPITRQSAIKDVSPHGVATADTRLLRFAPAALRRDGVTEMAMERRRRSARADRTRRKDARHDAARRAANMHADERLEHVYASVRVTGILSSDFSSRFAMPLLRADVAYERYYTCPRFLRCRALCRSSAMRAQPAPGDAMMMPGYTAVCRYDMRRYMQRKSACLCHADERHCNAPWRRRWQSATLSRALSPWSLFSTAGQKEGAPFIFVC